MSIPVSLAGNFGDLRTNHYHMGLDFRTQQRENIAVMAAAEGYVSRIKIEPYGYGRAIYITHPNGLVTLYAHLNSFFSSLETFVEAKQYSDKKWQQDFELAANLFPVKKGQFIAYSGNTGGSEGPHLHFEIRDARTGNNYNPLLFGLGIADGIPPAIYRLALYNRDVSIMENKPSYLPIGKKKIKNRIINNEYQTLDSVITVPAGKFSFAIGTEDKTNGSFMFGIYRAELYLDSVMQCAFSMDNFSYDDSRYINAGTDYASRYDGEPWVQLLTKLPGNHSPIFDKGGDGVLQLQDNTTHLIQIVVKDVAGNSTQLAYKIRRDTVARECRFDKSVAAKILSPNQKAIFETPDVKATFTTNSLYDTVYLRYKMQPRQLSYMSAIHSMGNCHIPVHDSITISIRANSKLTDAEKATTVMVTRSGRKFDAQKGIWKGDWMEAKWWTLGDFYLWRDTLAPKLTAVNVYDSAVFIKDRRLIFNATDETGDLQLFEGFIDCQWVIFRQKNNIYTYDFDEHCAPGWHAVRAVATDVAGNIKEYSCSFHNGILPKTELPATEQ
ncbi:MAG: M23 family metallopeptidase [Chitinophagaceae bacterium]